MATPKVRTLSQLAELVDGELGWRKKELSYLKTAIDRSASSARATYLRASVALLYAHWEGFVVATLRLYVSYVHMQRLTLREITPAMRVGGVISKLRQLELSPSSLNRVRLLVDYEESLSRPVDLKADKLIDAESNLNANRFIGLVACAGIDVSSFETASIFLDEALLAKRNAICHGEDVDIDREAYESIQSQVLDLMERVKNEVVNSAVEAKFREKKENG
ncbi:MAE_28990/MAE_18760 family HEPN-like nuclease [Luteimonas wenzhouensis]|uniref:RiboL-PSP-HEPN domain-containing protein n=1 Tax=Luteimonas wenzhouensis TaxID=2599615 RepID=A0A5C5U5E3_9GAMM|nr:MAE_28990/MAE_18760 family HEPN-like nuclease [Luteimonas wenzhouensis]TWT21563.1 hypothetical protein FQY79_00005 [Luteimonas wenzhouensis]